MKSANLARARIFHGAKSRCEASKSHACRKIASPNARLQPRSGIAASASLAGRLKSALRASANPLKFPAMTLPQKIIAGLTTKAEKIRALDRAGMARAEIARFLGISYQHVRNTLVQGAPSGRASPPRMVEMERAAPKPWSIHKLLDAGFELVGDCQLGEGNAFSYSAKAPTEAGVYAFAVDGVIKYVGLTRFGLRTRLGHYVYGHSAQKTSARVKGLILNALSAGCRVEVLVARPSEFAWNGLPVDGPSGLETGLIRLIKPEWNQQGNR